MLTKSDMMPASEALNTIDQLSSAITERAASFSEAASFAAGQWHKLGLLGAQRDDHAEAILVNQIKPELDSFVRFLNRCLEQIGTLD